MLDRRSFVFSLTTFPLVTVPVGKPLAGAQTVEDVKPLMIVVKDNAGRAILPSFPVCVDESRFFQGKGKMFARWQAVEDVEFEGRPSCFSIVRADGSEVYGGNFSCVHDRLKSGETLSVTIHLDLDPSDAKLSGWLLPARG